MINHNELWHSVLVAGAALVAAAASAPAQIQGPSSSATPYVLPVAPGVYTVSLLTVGDSVNSHGTQYRMVGIPDGLGAYPDDDGGTFHLLMNHELGATAGAVRAHGATGAFVSHWKIEAETLRVLQGEDQIEQVTLSTGIPRFGRLCSADLPAAGAFRGRTGGFGTSAPIYLNGEEVGSEGRAFAHFVRGGLSGQSFELPALGKLSWENAVTSPAPNDLTLVACLDDSTPGQVYLYVGNKRRHGTELERAGLVDGRLFGVRVPGVALESRSTGINDETRFELADLGDVSASSGAALQAQSTANSVTEFLRPEDGAWDPAAPRDFYFVTTDRFNTAVQVGRSRLWRLRFDDLANPAAGGDIAMLLDGTEGQQMMDNMCIDGLGRVLIQEDPGNQTYLARIWLYSIATDTLTLLAQHDPAMFVSGSPGFLTQDEESSGIIDASEVLGPGWFLFDVQAHYAQPGELVEGGQLLAMFVPVQ